MQLILVMNIQLAGIWKTSVLKEH